MNSLLIKFSVLINRLLMIFRRNTSIGVGFRMRGYVKWQCHPHSVVRIADNVQIISGVGKNPLGRSQRTSIRLDENAELQIGSNSGLTNVTIWCRSGLHIGTNVKVGGGVMFLDSNMHSLNYLDRQSTVDDLIGTISRPIVVGNDVFIGTGAVIMKGVALGDRSIIAAFSVVTKNVPPGEIWGGNPARLIRKIDQC